MPAKVYCDDDASLDSLTGRRIAILGYGSQGRAHALNMKDSGLDVTVGLRKDSSSWKVAEDDGMSVATVNEACSDADLVAMLVPDQNAADVYRESVEPNLKP